MITIKKERIKDARESTVIASKARTLLAVETTNQNHQYMDIQL